MRSIVSCLVALATVVAAPSAGWSQTLGELYRKSSPSALGGDIILQAQGIELGSIDDLIQASRAIRDQPPGGKVHMRVLRAGKVIELTTTSSGAGN